MLCASLALSGRFASLGSSSYSTVSGILLRIDRLACAVLLSLKLLSSRAVPQLLALPSEEAAPCLRFVHYPLGIG